MKMKLLRNINFNKNTAYEKGSIRKRRMNFFVLIYKMKFDKFTKRILNFFYNKKNKVQLVEECSKRFI